MQKVIQLWEKMPKSAKVFLYIALSTFLSEAVIELTSMEQTFIVRFLAQIINLGIVFIEDAVPAVKARLKK